MRHLDKHAGTVARFRVGTGGAAMHEMLQREDPFAHHIMGPAALYIANESHAAAVVLKPRVVKPLLLGQVLKCCFILRFFVHFRNQLCPWKAKKAASII